MGADPRVVRSRAAVLGAALELVAECGIPETSVEGIAERSGVAKTTIYRHWNSKAEVVLEAIGSTMTPPEDPDTGTLSEDLRRMLGDLAEALSSGPLSTYLTTIMDAAARDEEFAALHRRELSGRHVVVRDVIARGITRGELPAGTDPEEVLTMVTGPVFYRCTVTHGEVDKHFTDLVVDRVLSAYTTHHTDLWRGDHD